MKVLQNFVFKFSNNFRPLGRPIKFSLARKKSVSIGSNRFAKKNLKPNLFPATQNRF